MCSIKSQKARRCAEGECSRHPKAGSCETCSNWEPSFNGKRDLTDRDRSPAVRLGRGAPPKPERIQKRFAVKILRAQENREQSLLARSSRFGGQRMRFDRDFRTERRNP